ncbi:MAG: hypothetical protein ABI894_01305 [Ilumatobacteraceae bacterium]
MSGVNVAVECALRRGRTRKGRLIATIAAVAVGIAGLLLVAVAGTVAGDRALQRGVADLEPTERAFSVTMSPDLYPTTEQLADFNGKISGRLRRHGFGPVLHTVEYRALAAGDGRTVRFAGIDDLQMAARLVDGDWPARCDADRCEVVAIVADSGQPEAVAPLPADSPLGLTIVGTAIATSDLLLNGELRPDETEQIVLAEGVAEASGLPDYSLIRRTYAWQVPVMGEQLRSIDIVPLLAAVRSISTDLSLPALHVAGPEDDLLSISSRTRISGNRLVVPIAALLVLFFGVAVLAGLGGRADHQRTSALLRRRGARRAAMVTFRVIEAALPVVGGVIVGALIGLLLGTYFGHRAGLDGSSVLSRSIDGSLAVRLGAVSLFVWVLIFMTLSIDDALPVHRRRRPQASDVAGVAALVVLFVLIGRGSVSTGSLNRVIDPALVAVPILAAIALASVVVRVVPISLRVASTASPRRWPLTKLTLAEATAQPLRSIATASLIAVTVMFALLTFGYASTLRLGSSDQAAFAVPYDFRLQLGPALVRPQAVAPAGGWSTLTPATTATDVLRRGVAVRRSATNVQTVELLGIDPATLSHLHGWRSSFGPEPVELAKSIDAASPGTLGTTLPDDATSIVFSGTGLEGLRTAAVIARTNGTWHEITLDDDLRTALTPGDAGGELIGFRIAQPGDVSKLIEHHIGEGTTSLSARAIDVVLTGVHTTTADGRSASITLQADRLRAADAVIEPQHDSSLRVTGSILGASILVTPSGPGQESPLQAVMDPITARTAVDGIVALQTSSGTVRVHPTSIVDRFPGVGSRFAVIDIATLQPALDLLQPGAGTANELWLATDSGQHERLLAEQLGKSGFDTIEVDRRSTRQTALATDPLSIVTLLILTGSALVAIVLGACAVVFGAAADASDDRPLLRMLALERVGGRRLAGMVAGKSLAAVCLAIPLGLIGGRWLLQIATRLVAISATSGRPNPPLRLSVPWMLVAALSVALLLVLGVGALAGAASARRVPDEDLMRGTT